MPGAVEPEGTVMVPPAGGELELEVTED